MQPIRDAPDGRLKGVEMKKKLRMGWAIASAVWVFIMLNMSFHDLKYGLEYHLLHGRVQAAYQSKVAAYEQEKRDGEERIRNMLQAAKKYDDLQLLVLTSKRQAGPSAAAQMQASPDQPPTVYQRTLEEIATLERTYGKVTLRQYREQDSETETALINSMRAGLIVPQIREPRLAAVLFHMFAAPLVLLFALWIHEKGYRRISWLDRYFVTGRRPRHRVDAEIE